MTTESAVATAPSRWQRIRAWRAPLWLPLATLFALYAGGRLWLVVDFPIPIVHPDSGGYLALVDAMRSGEMPEFSARSPLYPLFLLAVLAPGDDLRFVMFAQMALSLAAGMLLIWSIFRISPWASVFSSVLVGGYFIDFETLEHDSAVLTESLFTSLLVAMMALVFLLFTSTSRLRWFILPGISTLAGLCVLTKPGGVYFLVLLVLLALYLWRRRVPWLQLLTLIIPFVVLLSSLMAYNRATIGSLALSTSDARELTLATQLYWETDPSYSPELNAVIDEVNQMNSERMGEEGVDALRNSWDPRLLSPVFLKGYYYGAENLVAELTDGSGGPEWRNTLLQVSRDSILKNPDLFAKHLYAMLGQYAFSVGYNHCYQPKSLAELTRIPEFLGTARDCEQSYYSRGDYRDFRKTLVVRSTIYWVDKGFSREQGNLDLTFMARGLQDESNRPEAVVVEAGQVELQQTPLTTIYVFLFNIFDPILTSVLWVIAACGVFVASLVVLTRRRLRHDGAFILGFILLAAAGNAVVVSAVEWSQPRYSYPLEWTYYVAVACVGLLAPSFRNILPISGVPNGPTGASESKEASVLVRTDGTDLGSTDEGPLDSSEGLTSVSGEAPESLGD